MAKFATPDKYAVGDWFIDPERSGRKPAKIIKVHGTKNGRVLFDLDDDGPGGVWVSSYPLDEQLERA